MLILLAILVAALVPLISTYYPELYKEVTVGIDLGTTYSVLAVCTGGQLKVVQFDDLGKERPLVPSYVYFNAEGKYIIGHEAKTRITERPEDTIYDVKRIIGRKFSDEVTMQEIANLPYKVVNNGTDYPTLVVNVGTAQEARYSPEEISSMVLAKLKARLEKYTGLRGMMGWKLRSATISVPANFNDDQKLATIRAGHLAGLAQVRLIEEPSAAALAYRLDKAPGTKNVLVFDFGGGTLDVALLLLDQDTFQVITTAGNAHLGGEDIDRTILKEMLKELETKSGRDNSKNEMIRETLKRAAEELKIALSSQMEASITVPGVNNGDDITFTWSRSRLESVLTGVFEQLVIPVKEVLEESSTPKSEIDNVVMVGGSSRIPLVREMLAEFFPDVKLNYDLDPDQAVALGAALTRNCG